MKVPDTDDFSLEDVRLAIELPHPTKQSVCFSNAIDSYFDPTYEGVKDRLSNFRNYGFVDSPLVAVANIQGMKESDASWSYLRTAPAGEIIANAEAIVYVDSIPGGYEIFRSFMDFDLSDIPPTATCTAAYFEIVEYDSFNSNVYRDVAVLHGTQSIPITTSDWNNFGSKALTGSQIINSFFELGKSYVNRTVNGVSGDFSAIESSFGGTLKLAILQEWHDWADDIPTQRSGFWAWDTNFGGQDIPSLLHRPRLVIEFTL